MIGTPTRALTPAGLAVVLVACASTPAGPAFDPTGRWEITMATGGMVSEGTMVIEAEGAGFSGRIASDNSEMEIRSAEVQGAAVTITASTAEGTLMVRLVADDQAMSGNWVLGSQRGTFYARRSGAS